MSDPIFLTMTGEHHGLVSAGCGSKTSIGRYAQVNHQDQIFALSLLSGWGYEKHSERRCMSFHKFIDKSTPLLALGINENERYFLEFDFYRINQFGHFEKYYFIELRGASIVALQMNFDLHSGLDTECITVAYDYIRCRHLVAATEYYHFALPANYNSLFSVQNPIVAARNAAQRSTLNSANVGRLLAAGGVYNQNVEGFKKVAEQLGGDAPKGFNQVLSEQSAGTLMAIGAMIGLGKGAASHIPSLDKVKKTQQILAGNAKQASIRNKKQLGQLGYERVWGPNDKGPLGNPNDVNSPAATFRGGSYTEKILDKDLILHRTYGDKAGPIGQYWSATPQNGGLQSQLDAALNPGWGNNASKIHTITIPKGTTVYMGAAAPQTINAGTGVLYGGAQQTFVPWSTLNNLGFK